MKKFLVFLIIVITIEDMLSQSFYLSSDTNIYQAAARGATYTPDNVFESNYNRYKRFIDFYGRRLQPSGNYSLISTAYTQYNTNFNPNAFIAPPANAISFGNWTDVGQNQSVPTTTDIGLGQVNRIQVDFDVDPTGQTFYVTSYKGGVFKTTDGGNNWINFYTDYQLPITQVTDLLLYKDLTTGDKYLYTAVGGHWLSTAQSNFSGLWRIKLNGTGNTWTNVSGNLTCPALLGSTPNSVVNKILINPNNINEMYLATNKGVFYSCTGTCTPPSTGTCMPAGTIWKKANLNSDIWGIAFDYSDPTFKSVYCSGQQIWHTTNADTNPFTSITNIIWPAEGNYAFDMGTNLPNGWSNNLSFIEFNINITTHPNRPNELYALVSYAGEAYTLKYDKTIPVSNFPNNFNILYQQNSMSLPFHKVRNYIHFSPFNSDVIAFAHNPTWSSGVARYNLATASFMDLLSLSYFPVASGGHGDGHDFTFIEPNKIMELNDGGVLLFDYAANQTFNKTGIGLGVTQLTGFDVFDKSGKDGIAGSFDDATHFANDLNIAAGNNWYYTGHFGDGSRCRYLPGGQTIFGTQGDNFRYSNSPSTCTSFGSINALGLLSSFFPQVKTSTTKNLFYRGLSELMLTNFDPFFSQTTNQIAHLEPIRNGNVYLSINGVSNWYSNNCANGYVYDFEVSDDDKIIYMTHGGNFDDNSISCDKQSLWSVLSTTTGGNNNPNINSPCTNPVYPHCWNVLGSQNTIQLAGIPYAITFNPGNPQQVWVGSGSYADPTNPTNNRLVAFSSNGGATWQDFSTGLPPLPINDLQVRKGTDYEIYAATDVGVYYRTSQMTTWAKVSTNLPNTTVMELKIDHCNNKLYAGTFGRGLWAIDLPITPVPGPMPKVVLSQNTTSTGTIYLMHDIEVPAGITLTYNNANVYLGANVQINVKIGGKLEVLNSTLQGYCDNNMWRNILVEGDPYLPQTPAPFGYYNNHGFVYINNSTIKDAKQAAVTCENGGVVRAENSSFLNNRKDLEFHYFPYFANAGYAKNCVFETNANLKEPGQTLDSRITAWAITGFNIQGCTFRNIAPNGSNGNYKGNGIYSIDAYYTLSDKFGNITTNTTNQADRNQFYNLNYGIYAISYNPVNSLGIYNSTFDFCTRGTYVNGIDFAKVQFCEYTSIPSSSINDPYVAYPAGRTKPYGLQFDNCRNYFCENNTFSGIAAINNIGLIVNNSSHTNATRAYYCDFENLKVGSAAYFDNYNNTSGVGLRFNCNKYSNNNFDVGILGGNSNTNTDVDHIQGFFGGPVPQQNLVRNLYNANCLPSANNQWFDDRTASPAQILHTNHSTQSGNGAGPYYTAPQSGCYDNAKLNVSYVGGNFERDQSTCPPLSTGGSGGGGSQRTLSNLLGSLNAGISFHKQNLNAEQNKLQAAGSHSLKALAAGNQNAVMVKDLLVQQGGLLSDSVLMAYFSNNFTPPGLAKEVHAQNAPVSAEVWQIIVNKNYPGGIFAQMQTAQNNNVSSPQQNQKQLINNIKAEIDYLFNEKLRLFLSDSLYRNADSVEANLLSSLYADKNEKLLDHYLYTKKFTQTSSKLNQLNNTKANQNYLQFKGDVLTALQHSLGLHSLNNNAAAKNRVLNLANTDFAKGQQQAQAIARLLWGNRYFEYTLLPEENLSNNSRELMTNDKVVENTLTDGSQLKLAPNPTADYCNIQYKLPNNSLTGKIIITDINGKQVQYYEVIASLSNVYFNTNQLKNGVYFVNLYSNNSLVKSNKLVIIK